ncbi:MAG: class I SAM-dependent methyltransferase [Marivibrio sp.]|uniref:class I SAM-dependent DNA methyltransferase n=1 Tax=Marivibrio sp. TaxID=2039719 RepID=UPI0032EDCF11
MSKAAIDPWLEKVYRADGEAALRAHYDAWALDYERDLMAAGYRYPPVGAALVARRAASDALILDGGCGTGLMGEALAAVGYRRLIGLDLSDGMLDVARAKGCYERLIKGALGARIDGVEDASLDACISFGTLTPGHAPPESLTGMVRAVKPGGFMIFSVSRPAWEEGGFGALADDLEAAGRWRCVERSTEIRAMPYSESEGDLTARIHVYRAAER